MAYNRIKKLSWLEMIKKIWAIFISNFGQIKWECLTEFFYGSYFSLTPYDHQDIIDTLEKGNYVILTRRNSHMSTYLCNLAHWKLTGRWGYYSHACINVEAATDNLFDSVKILESIGSGVRVSSFMQVFDCDAVCILRPKLPENLDWESAVEAGLKKLGSKYDNFFNLDDSCELSCVEIVLYCIKDLANYEKIFHGLMAMIGLQKNLTPDMYLESGSFEVVLEIKRGF